MKKTLVFGTADPFMKPAWGLLLGSKEAEFQNRQAEQDHNRNSRQQKKTVINAQFSFRMQLMK